MSPASSVEDTASPVRDGVFTALDEKEEPLALVGFAPTARQRALDDAVDDPAALAEDDEPHDVSVKGSPSGRCCRPCSRA
ncbi:hypothetical protein E0500_014060 [Streptomyces sp. KM273126]|uniref:hypothetical protein n=1 Tax=Streptomyces sp. KM273126 TaxID=2545247 RepID=UPI0014043B3B|nr:hypothetical protein [Streptomyces sp. KM273126]MBA2808496.1 hypothetical protein [Streptomyces sp. KM273126]